MDLKIGRAEFTTPTLSQHPPSAEFKLRAALERVRDICRSGNPNCDDLIEEVDKIVAAALEQK